MGGPPQRSAPTNPTAQSASELQACPPGWHDAKFPSVAQPLRAGPVDASASGSVHPFQAGRTDWLVKFLQQIMSLEDYQKYKSSFEPTPQKEEVPLSVQLANKIKERSTVMGRIEHCRNVCRDLETKLMKQPELLEEAVEHKATLQDEINEIEARIAASGAVGAFQLKSIRGSRSFIDSGRDNQ